MQSWMNGLRHGVFLIACIGASAAGVHAQGTEVTAARTVDPQGIPGSVGVSAAYGYVDDERDGFRGATRWHQESLSGDIRMGRSWLGVSANHTESRKHLKSHTLQSGPDAGSQVAGGRSRTISDGLVLRAGTALGDVNVGGFVGYDTGDTRELREAGAVTARWARDVTTSSFGAYASTLVDLGDGWYAMPTVQYLWLKTVSDATTDSLGQPVAEERDRLIRGSIGGEVGYQSIVADRIATVGVRPYLVHDFHPLRNFSDRTAMDLSVFATLSGEAVVTGIEVTTTLGRDDFNTVSGRLFVSMTF